MSLILSLETSTRLCSVAISADGMLRNSISIRSKGYSHAEQLHVLVDEILKTSGVAKEELSAIGISRGPGSFTGLRIGVSSAKGLAYALDVPLISCTSLEAMEDRMRSLHPGYDVYVPMLDARRMEVYCQEFNPSGEAQSEISAVVVDPESFGHLNGKKVLFAGDGALKCQDTLERQGWTFLEAFPEALGMTYRMQQALADSRFEDVAYFEPFYLKEFIAGKPRKML